MSLITINEKEYSFSDGMSVLDVAGEHDIWIPTLCHFSHLSDYGACRLCQVEYTVRGRTKVSTSCTLPAQEGMKVSTKSERVVRLRKLVMELILASVPHRSAIIEMAKKLGVDAERYEQRPDNDCMRCGMCVRACEEISTAQAINFAGRGMDRTITTPFGDPNNDCVLCGACVHVCPTGSRLLDLATISGRRPQELLSSFDAELRNRGAVDRPFPQALPNMPAIDPAVCLQLNCGGCGICEKVCQAKAIKFDDADSVEELQVGAVIAAPGFKPFKAADKYVLGYSRSDNIISSMEFERMLSTSGPFGGHVSRLSDHQPVRKLAFIQCVGSRDKQCGNSYCSSVCCMYAVKEAVIAKEHEHTIEPTIFYMDIRSHGKDFDKYVERAQDQYGVVFKRARIASMEENSRGQVEIIYENEDGSLGKEEFDMGVLSVGLEPGADFAELGNALSIEMNEHGFFATQALAPIDSSRPGIYLCGAAGGPKDIPETVVQASAAAARAGMLLKAARGTETQPKQYPDEVYMAGQGPRIGVFVCHCGSNIAGTVNVADVADYAEQLENVVYVERSLYTCSQDTQDRMKELVHDHNLNRMVVASCSPRTHEALFQETFREAGLNPYLFEMANIRDQCSWVHMDDKHAATAKAKDLLRMAIAKVRGARPLHTTLLDVTRTGLVVGGGLAGMNAALAIAEQGYDVTLVEKTKQLGGNLLSVDRNLEGKDIAAFCRNMAAQIETHARITVIYNAELTDSHGFVGNFETTVTAQQGAQKVDTVINHGITVLAIGGNESKPDEYLYGKNPGVMTQLEFSKRITDAKALPGDVVMIQCVGSRNEAHPYCSRICCITAIRNAIRVKQLSPETNVTVLYRDIRTYGFQEEYYSQARDLGVQFIRYLKEQPPQVTQRDGKCQVALYDPFLKQEVSMTAAALVLSARIDPNPDAEQLAPLFKVPLNAEHFFLEAHVKLRPVDFATEGVYVTGLAHYPKNMSETITQSLAVASRSATILSAEGIEAEARISTIRADRCVGCAACISTCAYSALTRDGERGLAVVNDGLCKGCGACTATCRSNAIDLKGFRDDQILEVLFNA